MGLVDHGLIFFALPWRTPAHLGMCSQQSGLLLDEPVRIEILRDLVPSPFATILAGHRDAIGHQIARDSKRRSPALRARAVPSGGCCATHGGSMGEVAGVGESAGSGFPRGLAHPRLHRT